MGFAEEWDYILAEGQRLIPSEAISVFNCYTKNTYESSYSAQLAIKGPAYSDLFVIYLIRYSERNDYYYAAYPTKKYALLKELGD